MSDIAIACPKCEKRMRAKEKHAGRSLSCPECGAKFRIPSEPPAKKGAAKQPAASAKSKAAADEWFVLTAGGKEYGPISKSKVDALVKAGKLNSQCQLLQDGWESWKWAGDVYPSLGSNGSSGNGGAATSDNPFDFSAADDSSSSYSSGSSSSSSPGGSRRGPAGGGWGLHIAIGGISLTVILILFIVAISGGGEIDYKYEANRRYRNNASAARVSEVVNRYHSKCLQEARSSGGNVQDKYFECMDQRVLPHLAR